MFRKHILKETIASMIPVQEEDFWNHVDNNGFYNVQYGQVTWYFNSRQKVIAIRDGEFVFYISNE